MCYPQRVTEHETSDEFSTLAEQLTRASWRLRRGSKKDLDALGISFGPARALRLIANEPEPIRIGDLAARLEVVPRSATTLVDALENAGLVARVADPRDRRSVLLEATTAGRALIDRMDLQRHATAAALFSELSPTERKQLHGLLARLLEPDGEEG